MIPKTENFEKERKMQRYKDKGKLKKRKNSKKQGKHFSIKENKETKTKNIHKGTKKGKQKGKKKTQRKERTQKLNFFEEKIQKNQKR